MSELTSAINKSANCRKQINELEIMVMARSITKLNITRLISSGWTKREVETDNYEVSKRMDSPWKRSEGKEKSSEFPKKTAQSKCLLGLKKLRM